MNAMGNYFGRVYPNRVGWIASAAVQVFDLIGAPGTIRTCDRLVRSPARFALISIRWPDLFWPKTPGYPLFISHLGRVFGQAACPYFHSFRPAAIRQAGALDGKKLREVV